MLIVVVLAGPSVLFRDELHAVVVDEDVRRPALHFVRRHGGLDGLDRGFDDGVQAFFVHGHLDGDVWKRSGVTAESLRLESGVELGVLSHLGDVTDHLKKVTDERLEEEQPEPDLGRDGKDEKKAHEVRVDVGFDGDQPVSGA